ncbi:phosphatidylglycerophosphatase A family protein [Calycomorphotria hydatis]|uniref:Phosphatidylglycerophosphatase A n=1 Tax=Calycomorphotria hydatis TaxID=2528027 RepID=A0A517T6H2_9PLAN|nr:phosphatidylglycerophosphatase A [Calycomorphotria hydatis]QDT63976.1 Phosphatidylglycerophosphatase A [Calycomorphotria hydatis]
MDEADSGISPQQSTQSMQRSIDRLILWLAHGFGLGLAPVAPGTVGSLWGLPLVWGASLLPLWGYWVLAAVMILLGGPICGFGAKWFKRTDPPQVVYDEIVAFFIVFAVVPVTWISAILGFALFRLFDITKPWPIRHLEKFPGGWGILIDDLMAAIYAGVVLWGMMWIINSLIH